jgi:hypothetical protein
MVKQIKINMEIKVSRNYNTVTLGISDEPINAETDLLFKENMRKILKILREEAINQLNLIGDIPK